MCGLALCFLVSGDLMAGGDNQLGLGLEEGRAERALLGTRIHQPRQDFHETMCVCRLDTVWTAVQMRRLRDKPFINRVDVSCVINAHVACVHFMNHPSGFGRSWVRGCVRQTDCRSMRQPCDNLVHGKGESCRKHWKKGGRV